MGRLRAVLAGIILLCPLSHVASANMIVGGLVHDHDKGKESVAAEGISVVQTETRFSFAEQLYSMKYSFTIDGDQLIDSDGTVVGTLGAEGFEFTQHYAASSPSGSSCDDHYRVLKIFGAAIYSSSYTCTDGTTIEDTGTLYPYSYPN